MIAINAENITNNTTTKNINKNEESKDNIKLLILNQLKYLHQ